jgi:signal transduction histidine kinase
MTQDHLGLFDTPPTRNQIRFGLGVVVLLFAILLLILPVRDVRLRQVDAFIPIVDSIMFVGELITATLLYAKANVYRSRALVVLASGYVFAALMAMAHVLTFPGAVAPAGLLGAGLSTSVWIATCWRATIPLSVILYVGLRRSDRAADPARERKAPNFGLGMFAAIALAAAIILLTTAGHDLLPPILADRRQAIQANLISSSLVSIALTIAALSWLFRTRHSILDMWLLVSLSAWLAQSLLNATLSSRYSAGFYCLFGLMLFSNLILMLALIAESNRLHMRLALSTAARERERDGRLLSMDAVTSAISHEVGQPLTAVLLGARGGLEWLNRPQPNLEMVDKSLRTTLESAQRTFDVVRSIRAMFAKGSAPPSEFSLNELVRETASLLDRELASGSVSLELQLQRSLPPIIADRVQIQRVLVNLFNNAIEALSETHGRPHRIRIRSTSLEGEEVLLEVSDTGGGIEPGEIEHIFDAFVTTKSTGTGLGLSLCRTIVEEHGGRLWASPGVEHGATFHLQLPCYGVAMP